MTDGDELSPVLNRLAGPDLYRNNAFRVTGLPTDASPSRVRRAREEALLVNRLPAAGSGRGTGRLRDHAEAETAGTAPGGEAMRAAYEVLRDPVARLVHELLWIWGPEVPPAQGESGHDAAVRAHQDALEGEATGPHAPDPARARQLDALWERGLDAWATVLAGHEFWDHAKRRVADIEDPRLTTGTVRRLRERLPRHIVAAGAEVGLRAARAQAQAEAQASDSPPPVPPPRRPPSHAPGARLAAPSAGTARPAAPDSLAALRRIVALLHASPFPAEVVTDALREVARPAERTVRAACTTARDTVSAHEEQGGTEGTELLEHTAEPLLLVQVLLGPEGSLTAALCEEVGAALNQCAVAHYHATETTRTALFLLDRASDLARVRRTRELIEKNIDVIGHSDTAVPTGPSDELQPYLRRMAGEGKVERVAAHLRAVAPALIDKPSGRRLLALSRDKRSVAAPVHGEPFLGSLLGCGVRPYRSEGPDAEGTLWATYAVALFWVPVLPLAMYVISDGRVCARVPLTARARWARRLVFTAALFALVWTLADPPTAVGLLVGFGVVQLFARAELRKARVRTWAQAVARR
ncbi:hypothetical protein [Streptomyces sp. CBMA29]|uniref:hypothetical protein n=1 Tax=Streptomyces sp. CBMA29 TaxID=1896314 RepID=UPI001661DC31|nr:hypothetical protein [Streptomyces sp. CBMA29]MBD0735321.1 hypothetical protein [Streptomyces sp. CBMA29]